MISVINTLVLFATMVLATATFSESADWNLPVTISSGSTKTGVVLGINAAASDGFDAGLDSPIPFTDEILNAYFNHPEWNITAGGAPVGTFHRDIRGSIPQTFSLGIKTDLAPLTVSWDSSLIPATLQAVLKANGETVNMNKAGSHVFANTGVLSQMDIEITPGDTAAPAAPVNLAFSVKGASIYLSWDANQEADLGGYKLYLLDGAGNTVRSLDLKKAANYNLINAINDLPYYLAVSAYDLSGNESGRSSVITATKVTPPQTASAADGDLDGDGSVTIADAIKVLRISVGMDASTTEAKSHGDMDGDGKLTIRDVIFLLRKSIAH